MMVQGHLHLDQSQWYCHQFDLFDCPCNTENHIDLDLKTPLDHRSDNLKVQAVRKIGKIASVILCNLPQRLTPLNLYLYP